MNDNDSNNISGTDWDHLAAMADEEIDYSDIPPLDDNFYARAVLRIPATQAQNLVQLDSDVMAWFRAQGGEYTALINTILRRYIKLRRN
jgi:uncharacterized protein (DUF4415 family)